MAAMKMLLTNLLLWDIIDQQPRLLSSESIAALPTGCFQPMIPARHRTSLRSNFGSRTPHQPYRNFLKTVLQSTTLPTQPSFHLSSTGVQIAQWSAKLLSVPSPLSIAISPNKSLPYLILSQCLLLPESEPILGISCLV